MQKLFDLVVDEGMTAKVAALITGNIRTAPHYIKKYNEGEEERLPFNCSKRRAGCKPKLTGDHSPFLKNFIDKHPSAVCPDIRRNLCESFLELSISISALRKYLVQKYEVTLKTPKKTPEIASSKDKGSRLRTAK
jgi:hypothetical protein